MHETRLQWNYSHPLTKREIGAHNPVVTDSMTTNIDPIAERISFLRSLQLFEGLNNEELRFLASEAKVRVYETGEIIFHEGEAGITCHIITRGKVRVFVIGEDGRELAISIFGPGEIIGEMALFDNLPRSASVEALEPTWTLELHQDVLLHGLAHSTTLARSLLRALSARLRHMTAEAEGLASMTVADRLILRLQRLAEWAGRPVADGILIGLPMTQQELATLIGTSRESVNRALAGLRRQGKIRLDNGWIVLLNK